MGFAPMEMLVLEFDTDRLRGEILEELKRLREKDIIRLVDLVVVAKSESGEITALEVEDLPADAMEHGGIAATLVGLGTFDDDSITGGTLLAGADPESGELTDDLWYVADAIPAGSVAAVALIEHRWAVPLRDAVARAGGVALADEWIHPEDLVGLEADRRTDP